MTKSTLLLSAQDIEQTLDMKAAVEIVESVFRAHGEGQVLMPPKLTLDMSSRGIPTSATAMPAYVPGMGVYGLKWVSVARENAGRGLPVVLGTLVLNDPHTGVPLAIMDGTTITTLRTGAVAGVAARHLAKPDAGVAAFVGCGTQAQSSLRGLMATVGLREVWATDRVAAAAGNLAQRAREHGLEAHAGDDMRAAVEHADIVVVATTANEPLVFQAWVRPGTLIVKLGSHNELDDRLTLGADRLIVDDRAQAEQRGELAHLFAIAQITQTQVHAELGEIIAGNKRGREQAEEIIVAALIGMGTEDVAVGAAIYRQAQRLQLGRLFQWG